MSDSLRPHESQHARPPCPSPTPGVYPNSCPSSQWCHLANSSSIVRFSSCPQSLPASGSFPMSQLFSRGGQSIGISASASVLPVNTKDWSPFICPSNKHPGLISFGMDWLDLLYILTFLALMLPITFVICIPIAFTKPRVSFHMEICAKKQ